MPVGGSRHYQGAGLGQIGLWGCPACGADNTGPLEQGCAHCGAGKPGVKAPTPPTPPTPEPRAEPTVAQGDRVQFDAAEYWASQHPTVSVAEAYRSGYYEGVRAARAAAAPPTAPMLDAPDAKTYRTVAAALALFRDQVLAERPEEVASGEWLSADEATNVIDQLQQLLGREPAHV